MAVGTASSHAASEEESIQEGRRQDEETAAVASTSSALQSAAMTGWLARNVVRQCVAKKVKSRLGQFNLQEHYLRDDISCGSPLCPHGCRGPTSLPANASHYLIPNAFALRHLWEMLELPQITAVVFLASVLKEVQMQLNLRDWRRLRALFMDKRRGNLYFDDEHFLYTKLAAERGTEDRRVELFSTWFSEHLQNSIPIIMITGFDGTAFDVNKITEESEESFKMTNKTDTGFKVFDATKYVQVFWSEDQIVLDLYNSLVQAYVELKQIPLAEGNDLVQPFYNEHLPATAIEEGLESGSLRTGIFHACRDLQGGGFVRPSNKGEATKLEIFIPNRKLQNRALHGDLVVVQVLSPKEAEKERDLSIPLDEEDEDLGSESDIDGDDVKLSGSKETAVTGEIVGILQRVQRDYVACLDEIEGETSCAPSSRQERLVCIPMDRRIPMIWIATRQRSRLIKQRFVVRVDKWDADSKLPRGHVLRILGPIGDLNTENTAILVENEINIAPFSTMSLDELPIDTDENPWCIPAKEFTDRWDLRFSHRTYSIDPPGSKDVDDCLSVKQLDNNRIQIGVHIADVSYFVREGSLLDLEAFSRGTTVYLVGNTFHMLPSVLSENLCSLRQGKDRLAVSVVWSVEAENDFEIVDFWFGRTVIHSSQQMFYAQAQAILDGKLLPAGWELNGDADERIKVQRDLSVLAKFAQVCRSLRESKGALELASAELRFEIGESQEPLSVDTKTQLPMHWIVAELMIQANTYVARRVYESFGAHSLLRRHPPPKLDSFSHLSKCCESQGIFLDTSSNKALAMSLIQIQESTDPTLQGALKALATRAMCEAEYVVAGEILDAYGLYHYGLALEVYTHFTSPIRRYADIVVHRLLTASCETNGTTHSDVHEMSIVKQPSTSFTPTELNQVVCHLNERHRASKRAQKNCNELHLLMYLQKHARAEHGVVIEIQQATLVVFVPKYDLRGQVQLQDKSGKIILPAKDDSEISEFSEYKHSRYILQKSEDSICIIEHQTGAVFQTYKRMMTVWVQMRADGTRAHTPTLRLHLLSDDHPAVQEARLAQNQFQYSVAGKFSKQLDKATSHEKRQLGQKKSKQMMEEIVREIAMPVSNLQDSTKPNEIKTPTFYELLEEFNYEMYSAFSIYSDNNQYEVWGSKRSHCLSTKEVSSNSTPKIESKEGIDSRNHSTTMWISRMDAIIKQEDPHNTLLRSSWQKKLFQASKRRTKQLRSGHSSSSTDALQRQMKERNTREKACSFLEGMQSTDYAS